MGYRRRECEDSADRYHRMLVDEETTVRTTKCPIFTCIPPSILTSSLLQSHCNSNVRKEIARLSNWTVHTTSCGSSRAAGMVVVVDLVAAS